MRERLKDIFFYDKKIIVLVAIILCLINYVNHDAFLITSLVFSIFLLWVQDWRIGKFGFYDLKLSFSNTLAAFTISLWLSFILYVIISPFLYTYIEPVDSSMFAIGFNNPLQTLLGVLLICVYPIIVITILVGYILNYLKYSFDKNRILVLTMATLVFSLRLLPYGISSFIISFLAFMSLGLIYLYFYKNSFTIYMVALFHNIFSVIILHYHIDYRMMDWFIDFTKSI